MSFEIGKEYFSFNFVDRKYLELEDVDVLYFEHIKNGAKLVQYDTPSATKGFYVHFKGGNYHKICDDVEHEVVKRKVSEFNSALNCTPLKAVEENILNPAPNEGLIVENDSHSLAFGVSLSVLPEDLRAAMKFLVNILNRQYIYENVRLRGGAYVCNAKFENGTLVLTSRRDPDIWKTYEIFNGVPDWLETLDITQADITQQNRFIADLGGLTKEQLLTEAIWNNVSGTEENLTFGMAKAVSELKVDSIELLKKILKIAFEDRVICAVASEEVIMAKTDLFERIVDLRSGI